MFRGSAAVDIPADAALTIHMYLLNTLQKTFFLLLSVSDGS
jgi:hypothetical protein